MQVPPSAEYFLPKGVPPQLAQGDIFVCASGTVVDAAGRGISLTPPPAPAFAHFGSTRHALAWGPPTEAVPAAPSTAFETRWGLVMVVSHECDLQKDFNAFARHLVRDRGRSREQAEAEAQDRTDLDPYVVVAPLLLEGEVAEEWPEELRTDDRLADVRNGQRLNYFPVRESAAHGLGAATVVPLGRLATVERRLLVPARHVASLASATVGNLRYRLGRMYASRDLSALREVEAAVGQKIVNVEVRQPPHSPSAKKKAVLALELHLADGAILHFEALEGTLRRDAPGGPGRVYQAVGSAGASEAAADGSMTAPPS